MFPRRKFSTIGKIIMFITGVIMIIKLQQSYLPENTSQSNEQNDILKSGISKLTLKKDEELLRNNLELDNIRKNLVIMRKYLEAANRSRSASVKSNANVTEMLSALSQQDIEKSKKILEDNKAMFLDIANFLEKENPDLRKPTIARIDNSKSNHNIKPISFHNEKERQIHKIKEWEPFYVNFESSKGVHEMNKLINAKKKVTEWDLFNVDFPNDESQDEVLINFKLSDILFKKFTDVVSKSTPGKVLLHIPKPRRLNIYSSDHYSWKRFHRHITQYQLYSPKDVVFQNVIKELQTMPFTETYQPTGGTQQKLVFTLENHLRVIFKPMRFPRKQEALPDHMFWRDYERHFAEIAAFHLDMVLEFYRVPPVVGRYINVTSEVKDLDSYNEITVFRSPAGNLCFYGKCDYYCDTAHAVCGRPDIIEGSFMMYLPSSTIVPRISWEHPWTRTYSKSQPKADWQFNKNYCDKVTSEGPYNNGRRLLDLIDMAIFDFFSGNMDRHHYETMEEFGNFTIPVLFDNGRGFGKSRHDEITILAPLYQCCKIRYTTLKKLIAFHQGPKHLSDIMRESMAKDLASPVLLEPHLTALDRRLQMVLRTVIKCINQHKYNTVVLYDGL